MFYYLFKSAFICNLFCASIFRPLAKLSYCVYISHFSVISALILYRMRSPMYSSKTANVSCSIQRYILPNRMRLVFVLPISHIYILFCLQVILFLKTMPLSYALGLMLCLCIELPGAAVYKHFNSKKIVPKVNAD